MDNNTFMGLLIAAIAVLLTMSVAITTIVIKPVIQLNRNMARLDDSINNLNKTANTMENRLDKQQEDIEDIHKDLRTFEGRISRVEAQKR